MRDMIGAQLRFSPEIRQELIGRGLKRFLFCTVIIMHVSIFLLPLTWYFFREWLTPPPPKVIEVTLVENPTAEPHSKRGTQSASRKSSADSPQDIAAPPGKVEDISDKIPDTPDVPDISKIKPKPKPRPKPKTKPKPAPKKEVVPKPVVKNETKVPSPKKTVEPTPKKKKRDISEDIMEYRKKHGKVYKVARDFGAKNTKSGSRTGNSSAQTRNRLAKDLEGMIGNGGTADWGSGGVYDSYIPILIDFIQREWKRVAPPDLGTKAVVPLYFDINGNGMVVSSSIKKRSGISVLDAAVNSLLRSMRRLPAPPDGKRCQFTINLRVGEE